MTAGSTKKYSALFCLKSLRQACVGLSAAFLRRILAAINEPPFSSIHLDSRFGYFHHNGFVQIFNPQNLFFTHHFSNWHTLFIDELHILYFSDIIEASFEIKRPSFCLYHCIIFQIPDHTAVGHFFWTQFNRITDLYPRFLGSIFVPRFSVLTRLSGHTALSFGKLGSRTLT